MQHMQRFTGFHNKVFEHGKGFVAALEVEGENIRNTLLLGFLSFFGLFDPIISIKNPKLVRLSGDETTINL